MTGHYEYQGAHGGNNIFSGGQNSSVLAGIPAFYSPPQQSFDTPEMQGSMQMILAKHIGTYVVAEFLVGTERLMRKQGVLYHVGTSYITLYDGQNNNFIVCDIFSIKFVYFYYPGQYPDRNYNILPSGSER